MTAAADDDEDDPAGFVRLRAGVVSLVLDTDAGMVRDVRVGGRLALDAVYCAVRRPDWSTAPSRVTGASVRSDDQGFEATLTVDHGGSGTEMTWRLELRGDAGEVSLTATGLVRRAGRPARAGLALLHPIGLAGHAVEVRTGAGWRTGAFEHRIAPHPLFTDVRALRQHLDDGARLDVELDAAYETEDHRNWMDAGWKSYTPPLHAPVVERAAGEALTQRVVLRGTAPGPSPAVPQPTDLLVERGAVGPLPAVGVTVGTATATALDALAPVLGAPAHLAVELGPDDLRAASTARGRWSDAAALATRWAVPLQVTLLAAPDDLDAWHRLLTRDGEAAPASVCVLDQDGGSGGLAHRQLRARLRRRGIRAGTGTGGHFAELNRDPPPTGSADFLQLAASAQVHHEDALLVADGPCALPAMVRDAQLLAAGVPVRIAPLTWERWGAPADRARHRTRDPGTATDRAARWLLRCVRGAVGAESLSVLRLDDLLEPGSREPTTAAWVLAWLAARRGRPVLPTRAPGWLTALVLGRPTDPEALLLSSSSRLRSVTLAGRQVDIPARGGVVVPARGAPHAIGPFGRMTP